VTTAMASSNQRTLPPVLGRLVSGTFWIALRTPLQAVLVLWTTQLILEAFGDKQMGAYYFAWSFGFLQFLLEFGISSALQRQISERYTQGDRDGVNRVIACGMSFYAAMAVIQIVVLLSLAYSPSMKARFAGESYDLIFRLFWLQAVMAPLYGLSMVVSSVLQAARRYDFIPRFEIGVVIIRFLILWVGVRWGGDRADFFLIIALQTVISAAIALGPAVWVMCRELDYYPHFRGARLSDYRSLFHVSFYMFLIQLSVVLADKIDTTILGVAISGQPESSIAIYSIVSKPFMQIRQIGWMLASIVMPAVASLAAARDERALDRIKYDGPRLHLGLLLPVTLLAWIYAGPFLSLWVGGRLGYDGAKLAPLMRLFLLATFPLILTVQAQMAIGMNRIALIAIASLAGSLLNLPVSYYLTRRLGVEGVIWGSVLTTLFSNFLIPGVYLFKILEVRWRDYLSRTLAGPVAGGLALVAVTLLVRLVWPVSTQGTSVLNRCIPLLVHLTIGSLAYIAGYLVTPTGRADLDLLVRKLRSRYAL